jgi:hypothetical protein
MGNFLKENGGVPLDHPRRCQAHNRSKHFGREGQPCRRYPAKGSNVCTMHGGAAPQVIRKAWLRRMIELDQKAQAEAAFNVMLPPEIHPLVGGGGRGRRKAAKPQEAAQPPTLAGVACISRAEHLARQGRAIIPDPPSGTRPRKPRVNPPQRPASERKLAERVAGPGNVSASPSGPQVPRLMAMEEAMAELPRRVNKRYR